MSTTDWQDISTAPKDGTPVLVYSPARTVTTPFVVARYRSGWGWDTLPGQWTTRPTHWMPLPAAPETGEGR